MTEATLVRAKNMLTTWVHLRGGVSSEKALDDDYAVCVSLAEVVAHVEKSMLTCQQRVGQVIMSPCPRSASVIGFIQL